MARMYQPQCLPEPRARRTVQVRLRGRTVRLVLRRGSLRLEEEDDLRARVGDPVRRSGDHVCERTADAVVPAEHPRVALPRLAEEVQAPGAGPGIPHPRLVMRSECPLGDRPGEAVADDDDIVALEREAGGVEASPADRHLDVVVLARTSAEEEIDRPAPCNAPRLCHGRKSLGHLGRRPRLPARELRDERLAVREPVQIQRRQRYIASCRTVDPRMSAAETPIVQYPSLNAETKFCP